MNAVKHGLTARDVVIGDEDPKAFETLRAELEADFEPSTRNRTRIGRAAGGATVAAPAYPRAGIGNRQISPKGGAGKLGVRDRILRGSAAWSSGKARSQSPLRRLIRRSQSNNNGEKHWPLAADVLQLFGASEEGGRAGGGN